MERGSTKRVKQLGFLLNKVFTVMFVFELFSVLGYLMYRVHIPSIRNTVMDRRLWQFTLILQIGQMLSVLLCTKIYKRSSAFIDVVLFFAVFNVVVDSYTLSYVVTTKFINTTLAINATFLLMDLMYVFIGTYIRFSFTWEEWTVYQQECDSGYYDGWGNYVLDAHPFRPDKAQSVIKAPKYTPKRSSSTSGMVDESMRRRKDRIKKHKQTVVDQLDSLDMLTKLPGLNEKEFDEDKLPVTKPLGAVGVIRMLVTAELTILYYYIIITLSLEFAPQFTGWLFCMHIFTSISAIAWLKMPETSEHIQETYQWLIVIAFTVFLIDLVQLIVVKGDDFGTLIASRWMLLGCALTYAFVVAFAGAELIFPAKYHRIFYGVQFGVNSFAILEISATAFYFSYAYATNIRPILWSNFIHLLSFTLAGAAMGSKRVLSGMSALAIIGFIVMLYDVSVLSLMSLIYDGPNQPLPTQYAIQVLLLLAPFCYQLIWVVVVPWANNLDVEKYYYSLMTEKVLVHNAVKFVYPTKETETMVWVTAAARSAEKTYFIIVYFIRAICIFEFALLYIFILILIDGPPPPWYEWLFLLHFLSFIASLLTLTFSFSTRMCTTFLVISAVICTIGDATLIGVLAHKVSGATMSVMSFFLIVDLLYISFFCVIYHKMNVGGFEMLYNMLRIEDRLKLSGRLFPHSDKSASIDKQSE